MEWGRDEPSRTWLTWPWVSALGKLVPIALGFEEKWGWIAGRVGELCEAKTLVTCGRPAYPNQRQYIERFVRHGKCARGVGGLCRGAMEDAQQFSSPPSAQMDRCLQEQALKLSSLTLAKPKIPLHTCSAWHTWHNSSWSLFVDRQRVALPTVPVETPDITERALRG